MLANAHGLGCVIALPYHMFIPGLPRDDYELRRVAEIRSEIALRLSKVLEEMSSEPRDDLLDQMALSQWNSERRERVFAPLKARAARIPEQSVAEGEQPLPDVLPEIN